MARAKTVKASDALGIYEEPYLSVRVAPPAEPLPLGSPHHKRMADAIISGVRSENQRRRLELESSALAAAYDADADGMVGSLMKGVEKLIRDNFGSSLANRVGDMTYEDAMLLMNAAIGEIPFAFRESLKAWESANPKARLSAPPIED